MLYEFLHTVELYLCEISLISVLSVVVGGAGGGHMVQDLSRES